MRFLMIAAAAAALSTAGVAHAQYPGPYGYGQYGGYGNDWNGGGGYARFDQEYRHTIEGIRHGLRDGSFSRWQADRFYRELESIRYDAMRSMRFGNYNHAYIQARMERLHQRMHFRHERNHERYDGYGSYGAYGGYGNQPGYSDYDHHHDDDR